VADVRPLTGRCAFVTGANSGIGEATARLLAAEGAAVGLVARRRDELERVARDLDRAASVPTDVADPDAVLRALDEVEAQLGPIDIVVSCAGIIGPTALADLTPDLWQRTIAVNLSGSYYVGREAGLRMYRRGGGQIVNVASDLAFTAVPGYTDYCASKAGVVGLTRGLAVELAPRVRVNAVAPGPVETPMLDHEFAVAHDPGRAWQETVQRVPLRRISKPVEIARAILFVIVDATYMTGSVLSLDGGTTVLNRLAGDAQE
jgi:NAD(P)-dependent dehydrogenase (short-subunit alcohol dehydrogenase family)